MQWCDGNSDTTNNKKVYFMVYIVKLRQGSGKDRQGMALKAKGLKA